MIGDKSSDELDVSVGNDVAPVPQDFLHDQEDTEVESRTQVLFSSADQFQPSPGWNTSRTARISSVEKNMKLVRL
jgi:hypothetical protein